MCDRGAHDGWSHATNIQAIKHMQLTYKQVNATYDLFA